MIRHKQWIAQITHSIPISFSYYIIIHYIYIHFILLEQLSLEAPCEYVHSGLVLGLDWAPCQLSSVLYLPYLSWPTQQLVIHPNDHISHMHPPLTTRRLNTAIQVNNMVRHISCTTDIYISYNYCYSTSSLYFFYTLGQAGWPVHSRRNN